MEIGFIGLGQMGAAIAYNLLQAGHQLIAYNRTREKTAQLAALGAQVAERPAYMLFRTRMKRRHPDDVDAVSGDDLPKRIHDTTKIAVDKLEFIVDPRRQEILVRQIKQSLVIGVCDMRKQRSVNRVPARRQTVEQRPPIVKAPAVECRDEHRHRRSAIRGCARWHRVTENPGLVFAQPSLGIFRPVAFEKLVR